ncbi:hypothetical protein [Frankia sp. QA3]|uniref:hypothetical protein n=1 Tax=Frankia sp. QA3 TaxID=710111 RepID=UPI000269CF7D|nr:hypothetical protein [Frankia sp. QA3]EIV96354.1 hypothetical protein FraQA3DRAFT_6243 [Frankia sp. QA3]
MSQKRTTLLGAAVAMTAAVTMLTVSPAQGATGKPTPAATTAVDANSAPDNAASARVSPSDATTSALTTIQERIAQYVAKNGTKYSFGSYTDPATGQIVLETDAPAGVVSSLTDLSSAQASQRQAAARLQVRHTGTSDAWHRRDDISPFYGGGGIQSGGGLCSSGYTVQNSAGTRFITTAGHCFATGAAVRTESNANAYGTVSNRHLPTVNGAAKDVELIGGQSYSGRIFTGGVTSSTSIPVVAAGTAYVGYTDYCFSGRTSGEQCGHTATSINAQVCTSSGCKSPVIAYTGGNVGTNGDSGAPFYAKDASGAWIRGHFIAFSSTTGWAEPWTVVAPTLGVSIVTG